MRVINAKKLSKKEVETILNDETSKSKKIMKLFESGLEVKEVADLLKIRYNFAYNVISNEIRKNDIEVEKEVKVSKKDQVIELHLQGKKIIEIATILKINYNQVWKYVNEQK